MSQPPAGMAPTRTSTMAVWALVCAVVGLFGCGVVLGPVAVALGRQARRTVRRTGEAGDGLAMAAIVVGWAAIGSWLLAVVLIAAAGFGP